MFKALSESFHARRWLRAAALALSALSHAHGVAAQDSAQARQSTSERPTRLGPYEIKLGDSSRVGLGFQGQLRTVLVNQPAGSDDRSTDESVELRRLRLSVKGAFWDDRLTMLCQLSFAPGNPEVIDIYGEYKARPALRVRLGQTKIPFTRHRAQSFSQLPLVDWDVATTELGAERQLGLMLSEGSDKARALHYALGLFAGPNARASYARGVADVYRENLPNRSSLRSSPETTRIHPELVAQVAYSTEGMDFSAVTDPEGGAVRAYVGLSGTWDLRPKFGQDYVARIAPELLLKAYHVALNAVGYVGSMNSSQDKLLWGQLGATLELTYRFHPRFEVAARYSRAENLTKLRADARQRRDALIERAGEDDRASVIAQYASAGQLRSTQETAAGFNAYIIGRSLAFQADVAWLRNALGEGLGLKDSARVRLQMQLGF